MAILFNDIVFGPIKSRRFGNSLGINLLPLTNKVCNFNCIYCECGWTNLKSIEVNYFSFEEIIEAIKLRFKNIAEEKTQIDCITFAGNGEPTMHPKFAEIIDAVIALRNKYLSKIKIAVLSNSALLGKKSVFEALKKVDLRVMKLDAASDNMFRKIDMPLSSKPVSWFINKLKEFKGDLIIQTIFLKGLYNNEIIDNTNEDEVNLWLKALQEINPKSVMIYTIDRETPVKELEKIPAEDLNNICAQVTNLGITANVYT
ncbi:MAG: radical SAM protein [Bacteroidia bacterium]